MFDNFESISLPCWEINEATAISNQREREGINDQFWAEVVFDKEFVHESWRDMVDG
jgi:hypothetical protein